MQKFTKTTGLRLLPPFATETGLTTYPHWTRGYDEIEAMESLGYCLIGGSAVWTKTGERELANWPSTHFSGVWSGEQRWS